MIKKSWAIGISALLAMATEIAPSARVKVRSLKLPVQNVTVQGSVLPAKAREAGVPPS